MNRCMMLATVLYLLVWAAGDVTPGQLATLRRLTAPR